MKLTREHNGKAETVEAKSPTLVTRLKSEGWKPVEEKPEKPAEQPRGNSGGKA
jgi:hypothetical protein